MKYSKSTGGFYSEAIHTEGMPPDVVEVSEADYLALLAGQAEGKVIRPSSKGAPLLAAPSPPSATSQILAIEATITNRRLREALLGTDGGWLKSADDQIAALRASLRA